MKASILIHLFRSDKIHRRKKNYRRKKFIWLIIQGQSLSPLEFKSDIKKLITLYPGSRIKRKYIGPTVAYAGMALPAMGKLLHIIFKQKTALKICL